MAIDWTKPLEFIDGTPVVLEPHDPKEDAAHTNGPNGTPDSEGDYWITSEEEGVRLRGYASLCVSSDGAEDGEPLVRNRGQTV